MSFITDLEANISETLSSEDRKTAIFTWAKEAWSDGAEYIRSNYSAAVNRADIASDGTISNHDTGSDVTDAYWGLDHIKADLRNKIKTDTSLFVYYGYISEDASSTRMLVVCDGKIYRFLDLGSNDASVYFNAAKAGIPNYSAAAYYTAQGDGAAATASTAAGDSAVVDNYDENNAN